LSEKTRLAAQKFWEVVPSVMHAIAAESRRSGNNLAPNHFRILRMVAHKSRNVSELAELQAVSVPSMSASVQTLVERGWLARERSPEDRRVTELHVTAKGKRVLATEYERLLGWMAGRLEKLSPEQIKHVEQSLDTLLHLFEDARVRLDLDEAT
jgi:DNA-binding MarR family transcriptional regulator